MQKNHFYYLLFSILLCLLFSCSENNNPVKEEAAPSLKSTIPANSATIAPQTESVRFIFDREIIVVNKSKITLNNQIVSEAFGSKDTLIISPGRLSEKTEYTLTVEKNAIKAQPGKLNTDVFSIRFTTSEFPKVETPALAVKNPSPEAQNLYNFLHENYGKKIISGTVANVSWNTNEADWVYKHTGKYPALNGFDYIHLHTNWIDYTNTSVVENWWKNNGIVNGLWHWNVPVSQGSSTFAFYTKTGEHAADGTSFDISKAVQEGTYENGIVKADLEKIADRLLLLKNKNIPVLWRPLHEAAGGWFWWGAKGSEPCKALWKMMFNYFEERGLNNLIWIWTAEPKDIVGGQNVWYPGDEYVDIVGRDIYNNQITSGLYTEYKTLQTRYPNKIITLSECGNVAGISEQWNAGATWSWFMPWYDYNRTSSDTAFGSEEHQYANAAYWKKAFADDKVISREQMPSLK